MKNVLKLLFAVCFIVVTFSACTTGKNAGESFNDTVILSNGVEMAVLADYNDGGLSQKDDTLPGWFGDVNSDHNFNVKAEEMDKISAVYMPNLSSDAQGFLVTDQQIGWCWGYPTDSIQDLSLTRNIADSTYILDINYDARIDINENISADDSRDILRFLLSFVSNDPVALENQIFEDCFVSEEPVITEDGWAIIGDCEVQWNANSGYGISFVIKQHSNAS